eukprot:jgi/Botrbrau1/9119/Bobra.0305s0023.1
MEALGGHVAGPKQVLYENTYICQPEGYGEAFAAKQHKLRAVVKEVIKDRMEKQQYDPVKGAQHAKQLADDLREKIKALGCQRHKLIVQVTLGQRKGQAVQVLSRCLWDANVDTCASEYYENQTLYCICQVYAHFFD